jgi:DNA-binding NarL/FixJ family response regulator
MQSPLRLLIADDHPVVCAGLLGMLVGQPDFVVVGEASDGALALALAEELRPDVILLDLRMPVLDGVGVIQQLRERGIPARVLVLTTYDSEHDIVRAVAAGATGYVLKDTPRERLFEAIRATAMGKSVLAPEAAARLLHRVRTPEAEPLSPRELDVLRLVARGVSNREIGRTLHISEATVKTHLANIFGKLGVDDRTAAVTVALQRSLIQL